MPNDSTTTDSITVTGKPSTGQAAKFYDYKDYTKTWKNYCPLCGRSGKLSDNPKGTAEGEITCDKSKGGCDADYDICTGGDKSGSYRAYLIDTNGKSNTKDNVDTSIGGGPAGGGTTNTTDATATGGAVQIPDQTFYGLIKQMIAAIDGVFIIANNMAYLLSFKQLYEYRTKYEDHIVEIKGSDIIKDSVQKDWTTQGAYNTIELTYNGGIIQYQHDALVETYGQNIFYYDFPDDDEETAKAKAQSLLAAHVRDFSTDLYLKCLYNPNITPGCWVKIPKTYTKVTGSISTAGYQRQQENKPQRHLRKGVNIENLVTTVQEMQNQQAKVIQKITTEDNEEYEVEIASKDYEIYFVQGYKLRWTPDQSPTMHLHLKYGPDTPEDPVVATIAVGGVSTGVSTGSNFGSDCFSICDICIENCRKILPYGHGRRADAEEYIRSHEPDSSYLQGRAKQGSSYAQEVAGKTPAEVYVMFRNKFNYACYSDSCDSAFPCCEDLWNNATAANCGDSTRMLKALFDAIGIPCYGIHVDGHYFNAVQIDGTWHTMDGTRGPKNTSAGFPDSGNYGYGSNPCGSGHC